MPTNFAIPGLMEMQSPVSDALDKLIVLEPHNSNNTNWIGMASIGPIQINNEAMPFPAASITMHFSRSGSVEELTLSSAASTITIENAATWEFVVPEQPLPLSPGLWDWIIKVTDTEGVTMKLYSGQILVQP